MAARKAGEPSAELFHRARKAVKRHRYAVEAASPVLVGNAEKIVENRKRLQDILGIPDSIVSAAFLRELGARHGIRSGQNGFTLRRAVRDETGWRNIVDDLKPFL